MMPVEPRDGSPSPRGSSRRRPYSPGLFASRTRSRFGLMAAFPDMLRRDRERGGMRVCQAAWPFGVSVPEYRELEAGTRAPTFEMWERICQLYGWPQTFRHPTQTLTERPPDDALCSPHAAAYVEQERGQGGRHGTPQRRASPAWLRCVF